MSERKMLTTALHHSIGTATPAMVHIALHDAQLITGEDYGQRLITSPEVLAEEQKMIQSARDGRGSADALAPGAMVDIPDWFNAGQAQALTHLCNSLDQVILLRGASGGQC